MVKHFQQLIAKQHYSGDLMSGGTKEGTIIFEEPIDDSDLTLNYYANIFDSDYSFQIKLD